VVVRASSRPEAVVVSSLVPLVDWVALRWWVKVRVV